MGVTVGAILAGLVNGLFGSGGGMVLLPFLLAGEREEPRRAFATSLGVMLPLSAVSALVYLRGLRLPCRVLLPVLAGGLVGGAAGGRWFRRVPVGLLRTLFALFLLYAGGRYLL